KTVDLDGHLFYRPIDGTRHGRCARIDVIECVHGLNSGYCTVLRKSSGKYLSALCTGNGVMPPRPHSEPCSMVSHNSSTSCRLRSRSTLASTRSMSSTPRV